jgi:hypothetical protein
MAPVSREGNAAAETELALFRVAGALRRVKVAQPIHGRTSCLALVPQSAFTSRGPDQAAVASRPAAGRPISARFQRRIHVANRAIGSGRLKK